MIKRKIAVILMSLLVCAGQGFGEEGKSATLLRVLVEPNRYHRETVRVTGFLHLEKGNDVLYLYAEDYRHQIYANSIWVDATDDMRDRDAELSGRYVVLEGYFDAEDRGDMNAHAGTLKRIKSFEVWSTLESPVAERV